MGKLIRKMLGIGDITDTEEDVIDKVVSISDDKGAVDGKQRAGLSVIDSITEGTSLMDIAKNGAFAGLSDEQRQSATFKTGTVLGASAFELGKAFDERIPKEEAYRRGASGIIGLFEILFSAKNVLDGLTSCDGRGERRSRRKPDYDVRDYDGHDDGDQVE